MYEQSSQKVLNYFIQTERLVTVDVTCGIAELIWHQVHHVFCELDFRPQRTVNTILLFVFGIEWFPVMFIIIIIIVIISYDYYYINIDITAIVIGVYHGYVTSILGRNIQKIFVNISVCFAKEVACCC